MIFEIWFTEQIFYWLCFVLCYCKFSVKKCFVLYMDQCRLLFEFTRIKIAVSALLCVLLHFKFQFQYEHFHDG